jgi:hypothetical protein
MDLLNILGEALKSERDVSNVDKIELKVPQLEIKDRMENQKAGRESRYKKVTEDQIHMDPADGFFFKYNPDKNTYYESNASFVFITGQPIRREMGKSRYRTAPHHHKLSSITHPDIGYSDWNFRVDKRSKKVILQRSWDDKNKLTATPITDPEIVKDALQIAIRYHPDLKNYSFSKMKVAEYLKTGAAALETGGAVKAYFVATGEEFKKYQKEGIKANNRDTTLTLDVKEAGKDTKVLRSHKKLYPVWGIGQIEIKDKDVFGEKVGEHFVAGKDIPGSDIKLIKTNMEKYFEKDFTPPDNLRAEIEKESPQLFVGRWGVIGTWEYIFIARDKAEWDYFLFTLRAPEHYTKRRGRRGARTKTTFDGYPETDVIEVRLVTDTRILMFKPETTKEDVQKFLASQWLNNRRIFYYMDYRVRQENVKPDTGYDIFFKKKYPDWLKYYMIVRPFEGEAGGALEVKSIVPPYTEK